MDRRVWMRNDAIASVDAQIRDHNRQAQSDADWAAFNDRLQWEVENLFRPPQWTWSPQP